MFPISNISFPNFTLKVPQHGHFVDYLPIPAKQGLKGPGRRPARPGGPVAWLAKPGASPRIRSSMGTELRARRLRRSRRALDEVAIELRTLPSEA